MALAVSTFLWISYLGGENLEYIHGNESFGTASPAQLGGTGSKRILADVPSSRIYVFLAYMYILSLFPGVHTYVHLLLAKALDAVVKLKAHSRFNQLIN